MHREELGANSWTAEYRRGLAWELYKTKLPKGIEGRDFHWVVKSMYQRRGVLLYALSIQKSKKAENCRNEKLILLKSKAASLLGVNPYFIRDYEQASLKFSLKQASSAISLALEADLKSKGVGVKSLNQHDILQELLVKVFAL